MNKIDVYVQQAMDIAGNTQKSILNQKQEFFALITDIITTTHMDIYTLMSLQKTDLPPSPPQAENT